MRISDWSSDVCSSDLLDIHFGNTIVPEITIDQCRDYADKRRAGKIGWVDEDGKRRGYRKADDGTIRRELGGILVPAISHAVKSKRLKEADVPHIEMPPEPEARDRWLTDAERERLLSAAMTVSRSEEPTSELQSLMRLSYAVCCLKQKK